MARKIIGTKDYASVNVVCKTCGRKQTVTGYIRFTLHGSTKAPFNEEFECDDCLRLDK